MLVLLLAATCSLHPPGVEAEFGKRALPWLPPDLARQVARHPRAFAAGFQAAGRWPAEFHRLSGNPNVEMAIVAQCERLVQAIRGRRPFEEVISGFGALAHLTLDHASPFPVDGGADPHATAFRAYVHSALPRIPVVFYGQEKTLLASPRAALQPFLARRRQVVASLAPLIREDLDRVGGPGQWRALDDRSTTFGAASLTLNHAGSDFVNLASWVWAQAGGLVPPIPQEDNTFLVWKGEPQPREAPRPFIRIRKAGH